MSKVTAFVKANPFKSGMAIGTVGGAAFAVAMLAVEWPEADVDALREAAEIWEDLADTVERSGKDANGIVESIWKNNSSRGMEVFKEVWERKVEKYPADVATYCRAVARACRDYAQVVETIRHVLIVLAVQMWVNILFTIAWGWGTAGVSTVVQKQLIEKVFKGRAVLQMKIFKLSVEKIIFNAFYYLGDSLVYAGDSRPCSGASSSSRASRRTSTAPRSPVSRRTGSSSSGGSPPPWSSTAFWTWPSWPPGPSTSLRPG